jgi:branched-chain amino acid transport system ATP-binding protein
MLNIRDLCASYGEAQVLRSVSLRVEPGEIVTLTGRNGAGKTTLLRCVMGLHRIGQGAISLDGVDLGPLAPYRRARLGLGWVPDDRGTFATLTVAESLALPPVSGPQAWSVDEVYAEFPALHARRDSPAAKLSGGEQQMLALARVLRAGARLLLCDEPTEGLSPLLVTRVGDILRRAKARGLTVLLVEQNLRFATTVADRHYLLAEGRVVEELANDQVRRREHELLTYLGI